MKTIIKDGAYERVSDEVGDFKVRNQGWNFSTKSGWKRNVRDMLLTEENVGLVKAKESPNKVEKKKNYQKPKRS